jgi:hypothetical protein
MPSMWYRSSSELPETTIHLVPSGTTGCSLLKCHCGWIIHLVSARAHQRVRRPLTLGERGVRKVFPGRVNQHELG